MADARTCNFIQPTFASPGGNANSLLRWLAAPRTTFT